MTPTDIVIIVLAGLACIVVAITAVHNKRKGKTGCGCDCSSCASCSHCHLKGEK